MDSSKVAIASKIFSDMDKKASLSDAEKARNAALKKTARLRELRLAKEAEERAAEALKPKKKRNAPKRRKLPEFVREA